MGIRKLDMVSIRVRDWDAAVRWYSDVLGLKVVWKENDDRFCELAFPEGGASLALVGSDDVDASAPARVLPDIQVLDLDRTVEELTAHGVAFLGPVRGGDEGFRIVTFADPEGNRLQLYEHTFG